MKRTCRKLIVKSRAPQPTLSKLLPNLRIITDPARLARLNAEVANIRLRTNRISECGCKRISSLVKCRHSVFEPALTAMAPVQSWEIR